ncbi:MAG: hypothetical protein GF344_15435 [Chitinivibrionales bacterium]|nr:hypothetical protein [Chitinivibrionales bacterium]MBD3358097.1 hypothetical protein [Chitinivibrionales bacterium]
MSKRQSKRQDRAVALRYRAEKEGAPRVVAKGEGELARRIQEVARNSGVPLRHDDDLVELLAQVDVDREIPPELYAAVAEMLSWIYRANDTMKRESIE